jgi:RNA polymerase sigma-70 factor (ECF subfamily)
VQQQTSISDEALASLLLQPQSRRQGFTLMVDTYGKRLYGHIRKMVLTHEDADDVLQNTLIKAWLHVEKFRGEAQLFTWLYRIATNECLTFMANTKRLQNLSLGDAGELLNSLAAKDSSYFNADEAQLKLQQAILTLPEKQRLVFNMRYFDELPYEQISGMLGTSVGALKASYHIAAEKIERLIIV